MKLLLHLSVNSHINLRVYFINIDANTLIVVTQTNMYPPDAIASSDLRYLIGITFVIECHRQYRMIQEEEGVFRAYM